MQHGAGVVDRFAGDEIDLDRQRTVFALQPHVGVGDAERTIVIGLVARQVVEIQEGVAGRSGLHRHRLVLVLGAFGGDQILVISRRKEGERIACGAALVDQELRGVAGDARRLLLMGGKQACEQRLRTNRRADDLAGVGVVAVVHIGLGVLGPVLDLRHPVDVEQAHERGLAVVAHRRRIGAREGIVAEEFAFAGLAERLSRSVEALDYEAYLPDRNLAPDRRKGGFRRVGGETPRRLRLFAERDDGEPVVRGAGHLVEIERRGVDEFFGESVPEGVASLVAGADRAEVLFGRLRVDGRVVERSVGGSAVGAAAPAKEGAGREKGDGK